jgi:hypothetical protein
MNLMPLIKIVKKSIDHEWHSHGHLKVSSQGKLMGQQVIPLLTPVLRHGIESRRDDRSSKGFEYPSGLEDFKNLHSKAEYMTEATASSNFYLAILARSIHDEFLGRDCAVLQSFAINKFKGAGFLQVTFINVPLF